MQCMSVMCVLLPFVHKNIHTSTKNMRSILAGLHGPNEKQCNEYPLKYLLFSREGNCNDLKTEVEGKVQGIINTHKAKVCYKKIIHMVCSWFSDLFHRQIICHG